MFKELFTESKSELEKLIPLIKTISKEIKRVKVQTDSGGEYIEVTFKNSDHRPDVVTFLRKNVRDLNYDYDGTALLISEK